MSPARLVSRRWLIYALGGGLGHLTRAVGLARVAARSGHRIRILTNSPFAGQIPFDRELGENAEVVRIDSTFNRDAVAAKVGTILKERDFDVLIVDTFPRGLAGELTPWFDRLKCPKVLIHRDIAPDYVRWGGLESVASRFDLLILPGERAPLGHHSHAVRTAPWLVRDREELLDRYDARYRLNVCGDDPRPVVIVVGCGRRDEIRSVRILANRLKESLVGSAIVLLSSVECPDDSVKDCGPVFWPLLELMAGIDILVGSGGYNTVYEARATATKLVALARPRKYDRQAERLSIAERAKDEAEVMSLVAENVARHSESTRIIQTYANGVHTAFELIERLTASRIS